MSARDPHAAAVDRREEAASRFLKALAAQLEAEERALEPLDTELLERAAEGRLDAAERAVWDELVARDPSVATRAAALAELAAAAYPSEREAGTVVPFDARRTAGRPTAVRPAFGWLAVAAAALGAIGLSYLFSRPPLPAEPAVSRSTPAAESRQLLFEDGFEGGDAGSWSSTSGPG